MIYPIQKIRSEFPILKIKVNNKPLVYLDNASSAQKPNVVIDYQNYFYRTQYAAVHRGVHTLSNLSTKKMEEVRAYIANFIHASSPKEIIFTKGTTEGINLVANSWGKCYLKKGDNIVISEMEHHSNIVPWQILSKNQESTLRVIPLLPDGKLNLTALDRLIDKRTRLLSITHISNTLGTINPLKNIIDYVRSINKSIVILIDGAQGIVHEIVDVQSLNCDFYVFSGHKLYGPSGTGILYGKESILKNMPPWEVGGGMVQTVNFDKGTSFLDLPWKFEAGSPNINGIAALGTAIEYINNIGLNEIKLHEFDIMQYAIKSLKKIKNITIYGSIKNRMGVISFNLNKYHAYDVGILLDQQGIAIRTGHHCTIPIMNYFNVSSMCRISLAMYTNKEDIDQLTHALVNIDHFFNRTKLNLN